MRYLAGFGILIFLGLGGLFLFQTKTVEFAAPAGILEILEGGAVLEKEIKKPKRLVNPPATVKAVYITSWTAGSPTQINRIAKLINETEINAVVIDVKDYSGYLSYDTGVPEAEKYQAEKAIIKDINGLISRFHEENVYVIARITVFQDPILARVRPDLAIHSKSKLTLKPNTQNLTPETLWLDHKKLAWIDPAAKEAWDYNIAIAKDAASRGFDEINFDYLRFASDGDLDDMTFPLWDEKTPKNKVISGFFKYLREQLAGVKISADLFGIATIKKDDLGIGQVIEDAYLYFDYVSPMIYPSHYAKGFMSYKNPAGYPYETVRYSMDSAIKRLQNYESGIMNNASTTNSTTIIIHNSKLRPWLQDFDLGANYEAAMIKKEIKAVYDSASGSPDLLNGWMLWDPANVYNIR